MIDIFKKQKIEKIQSLKKWQFSTFLITFLTTFEKTIENKGENTYNRFKTN